MLMEGPEMQRKRRKLERARRDALKGRIGRTRHETLVRELVAVHRLCRNGGVIVVWFALEGTLRHAIRSDLCLQGWRWSEADLAAKDILEAVYRRLRAERPPWIEGQPEHVALPGLQIERTRCAKCRAKLPEGHSKFCSRLHYALSVQTERSSHYFALAASSVLMIASARLRATSRVSTSFAPGLTTISPVSRISARVSDVIFAGTRAKFISTSILPTETSA